MNSVIEGRNLIITKANGNFEPYVTMKFKGFAKHEVARTSKLQGTMNPTWNQDFVLRPRAPSDILIVKLYDHEGHKNIHIGQAELLIGDYLNQGVRDIWLQLHKKPTILNKVHEALGSDLHLNIFVGTQFPCMHSTSTVLTYL
jgi:Ca2+-dependent lipid-binding protein